VRSYQQKKKCFVCLLAIHIQQQHSTTGNIEKKTFYCFAISGHTQLAHFHFHTQPPTLLLSIKKNLSYHLFLSFLILIIHPYVHKNVLYMLYSITST
jgi:hypothetical protein